MNTAFQRIEEYLEQPQNGWGLVIPSEFKPTDDDEFYCQGAVVPRAIIERLNGIASTVFEQWAHGVIYAAKTQLLDTLAAGGPTDRKQSPDCYAFEKKVANYPLTASMLETGWRMFQSTVVGKSKDECAAEGVKYKLFRYPVHFWVSPDGDNVIFPKLKLAGKQLPDFKGIYEERMLFSIEQIRKIPNEAIVKAMQSELNHCPSDVQNWTTANEVADWLAGHFTLAKVSPYGMADDDECEVHSVLQWLYLDVDAVFCNGLSNIQEHACTIAAFMGYCPERVFSDALDDEDQLLFERQYGMDPDYDVDEDDDARNRCDSGVT